MNGRLDFLVGQTTTATIQRVENHGTDEVSKLSLEAGPARSMGFDVGFLLIVVLTGGWIRVGGERGG